MKEEKDDLEKAVENMRTGVEDAGAERGQVFDNFALKAFHSNVVFTQTSTKRRTGISRLRCRNFELN